MPNQTAPIIPRRRIAQAKLAIAALGLVAASVHPSHAQSVDARRLAQQQALQKAIFDVLNDVTQNKAKAGPAIDYQHPTPGQVAEAKAWLGAIWAKAAQNDPSFEHADWPTDPQTQALLIEALLREKYDDASDQYIRQLVDTGQPPAVASVSPDLAAKLQSLLVLEGFDPASGTGNSGNSGLDPEGNPIGNAQAKTIYQHSTAHGTELPDTQIAGPGKTLTQPSTQIAIPSTQVSIPSTQVPIPSTQVPIPSTQVAIPSTQTEIPSTQVAMGSTQIEMPSPTQPDLEPDPALCGH